MILFVLVIDSYVESIYFIPQLLNLLVRCLLLRMDVLLKLRELTYQIHEPLLLVIVHIPLNLHFIHDLGMGCVCTLN